MSFIMLSLMLFSVFFIAVEAGHECEGEDCHICEIVELCSNTVRRMGEGAVTMFVSFMPLFFVVLAVSFANRIFSEETPVSQKVRMND